MEDLLLESSGAQERVTSWRVASGVVRGLYRTVKIKGPKVELGPGYLSPIRKASCPRFGIRARVLDTVLPKPFTVLFVIQPEA